MNKSRTTFWLSPSGLAAMGFVAAIGYFLITEHWAHTVAALPWALLLLCPLFHLFMHRGHGHGGHSHSRHGGGSADAAHSQGRKENTDAR